MHYFLFKHRPYESNPTLNHHAIKTNAPGAKWFDSTTTDKCIIQNYFSLVDSDSVYSAIEVADDAEAEKLMLIKHALASGTNRWYQGKLIYVFKDIDFTRMENEAVMMKLSDKGGYEEDPELTQKGNQLNYLNKKVTKFMGDVRWAASSFSPDLFKLLMEAEAKFEAELLAVREERKKAKHEANKQRKSLRGKLVKFAIYKDAR